MKKDSAKDSMGKFPVKVKDKSVESLPPQIIKSGADSSPPQLIRSDPEPSPPMILGFDETDRQIKAIEKCNKNKDCKDKTFNDDIKKAQSDLFLPYEALSNKPDEGQRYVVLEGIERETVDKVMATFVDEKAEGIMADLQNEPWYHGALPLEDISTLVAQSGDFLIRELEPYDGRGSMVC